MPILFKLFRPRKKLNILEKIAWERESNWEGEAYGAGKVCSSTMYKVDIDAAQRYHVKPSLCLLPPLHSTNRDFVNSEKGDRERFKAKIRVRVANIILQIRD